MKIKTLDLISIFQPIKLLTVKCLLLIGLSSAAFTALADKEEKRKPNSILKVSVAGLSVAQDALERYSDDVKVTLAQMIAFKTVAKEGDSILSNPEYIGFKQLIEKKANQFGLDYQDHGHLMIVGLGDGKDKLGIVTHGDVVAADPNKWKQSPFSLDDTSEPGRLIGRGTIDDKGAIAVALYAMKSIKENKLQLKRRIELIIYMAEESDWEPFQDFLKSYKVPELNVTIDSEYPVVTAEKGWGQIKFKIEQEPSDKGPIISNFNGGAFSGQIPEDASILVNNLSESGLKKIQQKAKQYSDIAFSSTKTEQGYLLSVQGLSAHSSTPEDGVNAVTHLADIVAEQPWAKSSSRSAILFLEQMIGTGLYAEKFAQVAFSHEFMGPMTLVPTLVRTSQETTEVTINIRRPIGKSAQQLKKELNDALLEWQNRSGVNFMELEVRLGQPPLLVKDAPHVQPLLDVFSYYTGVKNPKPISIGGSTNAKLLPSAVSFGPAMPGNVYSGHSEHEFILESQLLLNLQMFTAMMVEIGNLE